MGRLFKHILLLLMAVFMVVERESWWATADLADVAAKSKYQIECTMCTACDNPCNQVPPPQPPSPPPPSPPPPASSSNCPPPPSNPTYYSPPPPSQPTYGYSSPPPPSGNNGGGGGAFYPPPYSNYPWPPYQNYPGPPPPNPIVPYFPFWYHSPPQMSAAKSVHFPDSTIYTITLISILFCFL